MITRKPWLIGGIALAVPYLIVVILLYTSLLRTSEDGSGLGIYILLGLISLPGALIIDLLSSFGAYPTNDTLELIILVSTSVISYFAIGALLGAFYKVFIRSRKNIV